MLKRLYLDNCFTHQDRTFDFTQGVTGVVGKNESGKSLIVEMVRYALFGTGALRGQSSDYRQLHVELDFSVQGKDFSVVRKRNQATLKGEDLEVSGTRPVNEAIQRILGYDLMVFDVANACNQGGVEALSNMRPADRKRMVDRTVGLDTLDDLISFCGAQGNGKKKEAEGFARVLIEPQKPEQPEGYASAKELNSELTEAREKLARYQELKGQLGVAPEKPKRPKACKVKKTVAQLQTLLDEHTAHDQLIRKTLQEIESLALPTMSEEEVSLGLAQWEQFDRWGEKKNLLDRGENQCPSCGHTWPLAADALEAFSDVEETCEPEISKHELAKQTARQPNLTLLDELTGTLNTLQASIPDDPSEQLQVRAEYEALFAAYSVQKEAFEVYNQGLEERQKEFDTLEGIDDLVEGLSVRAKAAEAYETALYQYETALNHYTKNLEAHASIEALAQDYFRARKLIQDLKIEVKSHLLPALNKVASSLINQMTGGERSEILVDENFEILVDGQAIQTLSGSGKAVANLSIRVALGQILTNRTFSVFMADEVDAAMDDDRANYTAQALRNLSQSVNQIILVTHKDPETDHKIELTT